MAPNMFSGSLSASVSKPHCSQMPLIAANPAMPFAVEEVQPPAGAAAASS